MPRAQRQLSLPFSAIRNADFLSNHWLEKRLTLEPEWTDLRSNSDAALEVISALWERQKSLLPAYGDEAGIEEAFIQPVFDALGWKLKYQTFLQNRKPDYALFLSSDAHASAIGAGRASPDFWNYPKVVADAKAWDVSLDRPLGTGSTREYPPQQIEEYLNLSTLDYGIITNGQLWRLVPRRRDSHQPRFQTYLECNLAALLNRYSTNHLDFGTRDDFFRFFLFFSPHAYVSLPSADPLIARAITGSSAYRLSASEGLKDRVFEALRLCIEGFINYAPNALSPDTDLAACRANAFTLLYRLLFIFFAEDRQLLPFRKNQLYTDNRALSRHRNEIAEQLDKIKLGQLPELSAASTVHWQDLSQLFDLIDNGKATYGVPAYNGGLFNTDAHPFLQKNAIPDFYLARVIDALGRAVDPEHPDDPPFAVDYKDLAIQDLGNIYEGLLELRPNYALQPMQLIRARRRPSGQRAEERYIPASDPLPAGFEIAEQIQQHAVYLATDKGERRASGSYYTPHHIVNYIVEKTLGPLCQEIDQKLNAEIAATREEAKSKRGNARDIFDAKIAQLLTDFDDRVLALKVLDPAMGSGHFLLRACQFLAEEIATNPHAADPDAALLKDDIATIVFWKRKVVENCLYGVDLNPVAVELAKLALWLETVSTTQPLSFLDHHLRHGNSLVGAFVDQLEHLPGELPLVQNAFENQIAAKLPILLGTLDQIRSLPSNTVPQVKKKESLFLQTVEAQREPFRQIADLWISAHFAPPEARASAADYSVLVNALGATKAYAQARGAAAIEAALVAARAVSPFHWEIEFPDVFYGKHGRLANPGFHAIIGNPPYDVLSEKENKTDLSALQSYIKSQPRFAPSLRGKNNLYKLFICQTIHLLSIDARLGFITPMALLGDDATREIREAMFDAGSFSSADAFPQKDNPQNRVFAEAKLSTAIVEFEKTTNPTRRDTIFTVRAHTGATIEEAAQPTRLSATSLADYDPENLSIVTCTQLDWDAATKLMRSGNMDRLRKFAAFSQGEINETVEREKGTLATNGNGKLVTRGSSICLYILRPTSQGDNLWIDTKKFLDGKSPTSKAFDHRHRRIGWQESCPQNNFRRIITSLIPQNDFCNHKINYLAEPRTKLPLEFVLGLLNTKIADWYFRLGSTNAAVSHYQIGNLPCPIFAVKKLPSDRRMFALAKVALDANDFKKTLQLLEPACQAAPFPLAIQDIIIAAVERIIMIEQRRGEISRSDRSHLDPAAQPYQDLIDQLFYKMAGLSPEESAGLESRLAKML